MGDRSERYESLKNKAIGMVIITVIGMAFAASIPSSLVDTRIPLSRVSVLIDAVLSALIISLYVSISKSERTQSKQISEQVELMKAQLEGAYNPHLERVSTNIDDEGMLELEMTNKGNGSATNISLDPKTKITNSDYELTVYADLHSNSNHLDPGHSNMFRFKTLFELKNNSSKVGSGDNLHDLSDYLHEEDVDFIKWSFYINYNTILEDGKQTHLGKYRQLID